MIAKKLDMYGIVSYRKGQLLVNWLCWSYPCHHGNFHEPFQVQPTDAGPCNKAMPIGKRQLIQLKEKFV